MSPMPKGLVSQIYAFETTDKNFNDPFAEGAIFNSFSWYINGDERIQNVFE